jgi:signal transduction histidine kinase
MKSRRILLPAWEFSVLLPTLLLLAWGLIWHAHSFLHPTKTSNLPILFIWCGLVALVDLLPVPAWRDLQVSMAFLVLVAIAVLYEPYVAAAIAFLGSFDPREFKGQITALKALFNRSQIALSVALVGAIFHLWAEVSSPWYVVFGATILAVATGYALNVFTVSIHAGIDYGVSPTVIVKRMRIGGVTEFLVSYVGLGVLGAIVARLFDAAGPLAVVTVLAPLLFARQMFFRTMALEEAHKELKDRERVLRALSNRMAEERQDERMSIAGYLHDDLAQTLFRLTLQLETAKKRLTQGDVEGVTRDLEGMTNTKQQTADMVRALIKDLHRSPIGRKGLSESIRSFAQDMTRGSEVRMIAEVVEVSLPPPIQLLIYQIAREAAMNALKHASPKNIWVSLHETKDGVELQIRDDGTGFDTSEAQPEGHFGSVMMRERAQVAGGKFTITSELGKGTVVTAGFPKVWVEEGTRLESEEALRGEPSPTAARAASDPAGPMARRSSRPVSPSQKEEAAPANGHSDPDGQDSSVTRAIPAPH